MLILVTGATGFLGSHLVRHLVQAGHEINAIRRASSSARRLGDVEKKIHWFTVEAENRVASAAFVGVDVVVHTAACYGRAGETELEVVRANTLFPLAVLAGAVEHCIRKFIHTDSALPPETSPYALSKAQFSQWGKLMADFRGLNFINARLEHFYGPGDDNVKFTSRVIASCLNNTPELPLTAGDQQRDFAYIGDVVEALRLLIADSGRAGTGYVEVPIGSGTTTTVRELVEMIHTITRSRTRLLFGAISPRPKEVRYSCADLTLMNRLGWKPATTLRTGLELTISSMHQP